MKDHLIGLLALILLCVVSAACHEDNEVERPQVTVECSEGEAQGCSSDSGCGGGTQTCEGGVFGECVFPAEVCDGVDNDCDGETDEDFATLGQACDVGQGACAASGVLVCGDANNVVCAATEGTPSVETCDGIDNDCDGVVDEDDAGQALTQTCYDGPDGTQDVGICASGTQTCADGAFGTCDGQVTPGTEVCDQLDNDCDGEDDNLAEGSCDCEPGDVRDCYSGPDGTEGVGICTGGTQTCADDGTGYGPCEGEVVPEVEVCDDVDHDCNGDPANAPGTNEACTNGVGACEAAGVTACGEDGTIVCNATPGEPGDEVCDGIDNDCNGVDDDVVGAGDVCSVGAGACEATGVRVCDVEAQALVCDATPGTAEDEVCDGIDNDCDGDIDEDDDGAALTQTCYDGPDGTEGVGICTGGTQTCADGAFGACDGQVTPGTEICDQLDNDCDGEDDNIEVGTCACEPGDVRDCYSGPDGTEGVGICTGGTQTCADDGTGYGPCEGEVVPEVEVCDDVDHDCNGDPTNAPGTAEACTNGVGACEVAGVTVCAPDGSVVCNATPGLPGLELCDGIDNDCNGVDDDVVGVGDVCTNGVGACEAAGVRVCDLVAEALTCDATPGTPEVEACDGVDNDCDGDIDEDEDGAALTQACYSGPDGTEDVGICTGGTQTCADGAFGVCDGEVVPGTEICDQLDNDCDGEDDNIAVGTCVCEPGDVRSCYSGPDGTEGVGICTGGTQTCADDGTGYGACDGEIVPEVEVCDDVDHDCNGDPTNAPGTNEACTNGVGACEAAGVTVCAPDGSVVCDATPGAPVAETCDGVDNDCNGVDDDVVGLGDACTNGVGACEAAGVRVCDLVAEALVCDATPGAPAAEICDGLDNDCNGVDDDVVGLGDACTNGVGACEAAGVQVCDVVGQTLVCDATPGAPVAETCDGLDNDCNGVDDDVVGLGDACTNGVGACEVAGVQVCDLVAETLVCNATPGAPVAETCDGVDNDCNGVDDDVVGLGDACTNGVGACEAAGVRVCDLVAEALVCDATPGAPQAETCDGVDNDCNGVDDDVVGLGDACTNGVGVCEAAGVRVCDLVAEALVCDATPGLPVAEICDGLDNDCNGVDDDVVGLGDACTNGVGACEAAGVRVCDVVGQTLVCDATPGAPVAETCDGIDNDCNGVDDDVVGLGDACTNGEGACEAAGVRVCDLVAEALVCDAVPGVPGVETCDGIDNDCNGDVDDVPGYGFVCSVGIGPCETVGVQLCDLDTGTLVCDATPGTPEAEICDGVDNDCNGVDDDVVGLGDACTNGVGACEAAGVQVCDTVAVALVCDAAPGAPEAETCDGLDNDCNGVDDDVVGLGDACSDGVGACEAAGVQVCDLVAEALVCDATPGAPEAETCDGIDNDCNGVDDDVVGAGDVCTAGVGACEAFGVQLCDLDTGALVCDAVPGVPSVELCDDGVDNDCNGVADCEDAACAATPTCPCGDGSVFADAGENCDDGNVIPGDGCSATCRVETGYSCFDDAIFTCEGGQTPDAFRLEAGAELPGAGAPNGQAFADSCPEGYLLTGARLYVDPWRGGAHNRQYISEFVGLCSKITFAGPAVRLESSDTSTPERGGQIGAPDAFLSCPAHHAVVGYTLWEDVGDDGITPHLAGLRLECAPLELNDGSLVFGPTVSSGQAGGTQTPLGTFTCGADQLVKAVAGHNDPETFGGVVFRFAMRCDDVASACRIPSVCGEIYGNSNIDPGEQCDDGNTLGDDGCSSTMRVEDGYLCGNARVGSCADGDEPTTSRLVRTDALTPVGDIPSNDGVFFSDTCPDGQIPVGMFFESYDDAIANRYLPQLIQTICASVVIEGDDLTLLPGARLPQRGDTGFDDLYVTSICPPNHAIVGHRGWTTTRAGEQIMSGFQLRCAPVEAQGGALVRNGPTVDLEVVGEQETLVGAFECPAGELASGQEGRLIRAFDAFVAQLTFRCGAPSGVCNNPSYCLEACGNGIKDNGEECDDGNTTPDDGCDASCRYEFGFGCDGDLFTSCGGADVPDTLTAQVEAGLPAMGDLTDEAFDDVCPAGELLTGVDVYTAEGATGGETVIGLVQGICSHVYLAPDEVHLIESTRLPTRGNSASVLTSLRCPNNHVLAGYSGGTASDGGARPSELTLECAPIVKQGDSFAVAGPIYSTQPAGVSSASVGPRVCPAGQAVVGLTGHVESFRIGQLSMTCASLADACTQPDPCFGIPVCIYDFDDGVFPPEFTTGGAADWFVDPTDGEGGTGAMKSGDLPLSPAVSNLRLDGVVFGEHGRIDFRYNAGGNFDNIFQDFEFFVDGVRRLRDWRTGWESYHDINVSSGAHDLRWANDAGPFDGRTSTPSRVDTIVLHDVVCD